MARTHRDCPCIVGVSVAGVVILITVAAALLVGQQVREPALVWDLPGDQRILRWPYWHALCESYTVQAYAGTAPNFDIWNFKDNPTNRIAKKRLKHQLCGSGDLSKGKYEPFYFHLLRGTNLSMRVAIDSPRHNVSANSTKSVQILMFRTTSQYNKWTDGLEQTPAPDELALLTSKDETCHTISREFSINETDDYVVVLYNNDKAFKRVHHFIYTANFQLDRTQYSDVLNRKGIRIASESRNKEISNPPGHGWYILTYATVKTIPKEQLESTEVKITCETNPLMFFLVFAVGPAILLLILGFVTWRIQNAVNQDLYRGERRPLLANA